MEIWKGSYIEVPDLVQIFNNDFPIPTKNDCFHVNTSPPDEIEKNPFILMLCKGTNLCNPPSIHLKLEPSWDVKACIMPLADLYAVPKCDILDGILSQ